jgi:hypothetical protein
LRGRSFGEYFEFYDENFDRVGFLRVDENILDEPTDIPNIEDMEDVEEENNSVDDENSEDFVF